MTNKKILVIDNEKAICQFLKDFLTEKGYEVFIATSGAEGLKIIEESPPDLILLDVNMPHMSGVEFYAKLASMNRGFPRIPIIVLSGLGEMKPVFENLYVYAFVSKPIVPIDFIEIVHRFFQEIQTK